MREVLEGQPNLFIKQAEVVDLIVEENDPASQQLGANRIVRGLKLRDGRTIHAAATIVTTGTFLNGLIHCGEQQYTAGRSGEPASVLLGESSSASACASAASRPEPRRASTAAPSTGASFEEQPGDEDPTPFSFRTERNRAAADHAATSLIRRRRPCD